MATGTEAYECLTYCALPYRGDGWTQTCVGVLANFPAAGIHPTLVTPRVRKELPETVGLSEGLPFPLSVLPWKLVAESSRGWLDRCFTESIDGADPATTIAYFWPGAPPELVDRVRNAGFLTVREMINTFQGTAKRILDDAYRRSDLPQQKAISVEDVTLEAQELPLYDYIFASNPKVEESLSEAGIPQERILSVSFGWNASRFDGAARRAHGRRQPLRLLFAGLIGVRKGVPELLSAWQDSGIDGELLLVGQIEDAIRPRLSAATETGRVKVLPFTDRIADLYLTSDIFVFPTLEEGGPQVTLEAGGCGMPIVTTAMGAARLVKDGVNGLIVKEGDIAGLRWAIRRLAADPALRGRLGRRARKDALAFTYDKVSAARAGILVDLLVARRDHCRPAPASYLRRIGA